MFDKGQKDSMKRNTATHALMEDIIKLRGLHRDVCLVS